MSFLDLAKKRQSTRKYSDRPVENDKIQRCLEAARLAPSACNSQPWKFIVIDEPQLKDTVAKETFGKLISFNHFSLQAPTLVVIVSEKANLTSTLGSIVYRKDFRLMDVAIAAEHFCLQATEEGLGTCMLGWLDEKAVKKSLNIPRRKTVELIITVGYPADDNIRPKNRKSLDQITSHNKYE